MVEEGVTEGLSRRIRGVDEFKIIEFVTTRGCRRAVISMYLNGKVIECGEDRMARCDGCGEGLTALERTFKKAVRDRQVVEETLDELADNCASCWMRIGGGSSGGESSGIRSEEGWIYTGFTYKERER